MKSKSDVTLASIFVILTLLAGLTGCGGARTSVVTTTPPSNPPPLGPPSTSSGENPIAFLRLAFSGSPSSTQPQLQEARRDARSAHALDRQAPIPSLQAADIYLLPFLPGWWYGTERKITSTPGAYTSVYVSPSQKNIVFTAVVNGYNQIFVSKVPAANETIAPIQLTSDLEHHWVPHLSYDGSRIAFTKFDPASNGDVVCMIPSAGTATETCLDFSATKPVLRGANLWHVSWVFANQLMFEAWGGPFGYDELFVVNTDGTGLTQFTHAAGGQIHYESATATSWGDSIVAAGCDAGGSCSLYELTRDGKIWLYESGAWDPLDAGVTLVWVYGSRNSPVNDIGIDLAWDRKALGSGFFERGAR